MVTNSLLVLRRSAAVCAALALSAVMACGGDADPPKGFGVNVTVNASAISETDRARVVSGRVLASNGPASEVAIGSAIRSGEVRFRFVPQATSGSLVLALEALDAAGVVVASGVSTAVELLPNQAVATTIVLALGPLPSTGDGGVFDVDATVGKANGVACTTNAECASNACADGVCCNATCSGTCESCALAGALGTCTPIPDETDPELECAPVIPMAPEGDAGVGSDAGSVDGGVELNFPATGLMRNAAVCGGKCNGQRACKFPGASTSCGTKWCNEPTEPAAMVCDGAGSCEPQLSQCSDYACNNGACLTQCAKHEDCRMETNYCASDNTCKPKKAKGIGCMAGEECQSGHCANGFCCNTACTAPSQCNVMGSIGDCRCPGVTCNAGVACQIFYRDDDGDGFGDPAKPLPACAGLPPANHVANDKDCDDGDFNVKPGQTAYFDVPSKGKATYDYNCDGIRTKQYLDALGSACLFQYGTECGINASAKCNTAGHFAGNGCAMSCLVKPPLLTFALVSPIIRPISPSCSPQPRDGFTGPVDCGVLSAKFRVCGKCSLAGGTAASVTEISRRQACR